MSKKQKMKSEREKKLQSMVKFDAVTVELFHMDSYEYEKYVAVMFAAKLFQATTQTNDDGLDEDVQTDSHESKSKWTQCPPKWTQMGFKRDLHQSRQEIIGVGDELRALDDQEYEDSMNMQIDKMRNTAEMGNFMSKAGKLMLTVLEYKKRTRIPSQNGNNNPESNVKHSDHKMLLERGLSVMKNLRMHSITACGEFIACSNGQPLQNPEISKKNASKNIVTIWSLKEPSLPLYFLRVWGDVTILRMHLLSHLVVTGNKDGSLNFWHLKEPIQYHSRYQDQVIRTPSVNTGCVTGTANHTLPILGLEIVPESKSSSLVISVDKEKYLICWSCIFMNDADLNQHNLSNNHSAWSKLRVSVRNVIKMDEAFSTPFLDVYCLNVWKTDIVNFVVGTNAGFIGTGTLDEKVPSFEKCYVGSNIILNIKSVQRNQLLGVIAGSCEDEYCRLFDLRRKRAILSLECGGIGAPIKVLWSQIRECLLYIGQENQIEAWDLLASDLSPVKVIPMENLTDFTIFTVGGKELIVLIAANELSVLTVPIIIKSLDDKEKLRFKRYISII